MSVFNMSDAATLETMAAESIASEHMPKVELKGMLEASRVERGNNYVPNGALQFCNR